MKYPRRVVTRVKAENDRRASQIGYFPASMVGYLDDLAEALQRDGVSESELAGIAEEHQMEIVGPPSERYL